MACRSTRLLQIDDLAYALTVQASGGSNRTAVGFVTSHGLTAEIGHQQHLEVRPLAAAIYRDGNSKPSRR
jgi:hypothetical protein